MQGDNSLSKKDLSCNRLIPVGEEKVVLVLLNCGEIEQLTCWKNSRSNNVMCSQSDEAFPFVIGAVKVSNTTKLDRLEKWKNDEMLKYHQSLDNDEYLKRLKSMKEYQRLYSTDQIHYHYALFFQQPHWKILYKLGLAKPDFVSCLKWAIHNNDPKTVQQIAHYVNLSARIDDHFTYLLLAAFYGYRDVAEKLIESFPDENEPRLIDAKTDDGLNSLHLSSRSLQYETSSLLVAKGIEIDKTDSFIGKTPTAYAIECASLRLVGLFIHNGADKEREFTFLEDYSLKLSKKMGYMDLVDKYLRVKHPEYREFYLAFEMVLKGQFHFLDRENQDFQDLIPIQIVLSDPDWCKVSFFTQDKLKQLIQNDEFFDIDSLSIDDLCEKVATIIEEQEPDDQKLLETLNMKCLYCQLSFETLDDIYTTEDMLKCGVVHLNCRVNHLVTCKTCEKLILNVREPSLILLEETFYETNPKESDVKEITQFLERSNL